MTNFRFTLFVKNSKIGKISVSSFGKEVEISSEKEKEKVEEGEKNQRLHLEEQFPRQRSRKR